MLTHLAANATILVYNRGYRFGSHFLIRHWTCSSGRNRVGLRYAFSNVFGSVSCTAHVYAICGEVNRSQLNMSFKEEFIWSIA
jgi:hypothetical protein